MARKRSRASDWRRMMDGRKSNGTRIENVIRRKRRLKRFWEQQKEKEEEGKEINA